MHRDEIDIFLPSQSRYNLSLPKMQAKGIQQKEEPTSFDLVDDYIIIDETIFTSIYINTNRSHFSQSQVQHLFIHSHS